MTWPTFLFGASDEFDQFSKAPSNEHQKQYAAFAQDEWKVTPRLTLTAGLRYEYTTPETDSKGFSFTMLPGVQSTRFPGAPIGFVVPGDPGAPRGWYFPDRKNFSPRMGFAWDPKGDGKTSIRGGFGMFFDTLNGWMSDWATDEAPWAGGAAVVFDPTAAGVLPADAGSPIMSHPYQTAGQADPFPSKIPPPSDINFTAAGFLPFLGSGNNFVNPHLKTPYIYQYNLSVQRQFSNSLMAEIGYAGSSSHGLLTWVDQNPFVLGTTHRVLNVSQGLDDSTYGFMATFDGLNNANYNGLLTSVTKRAGDVPVLGNVFFTAAYTWSHNLDNGSGFNSRITAIPFYNRHQFYGNSDFDVRQRFTLSGGWELPFAKAWDNGPKRLTSGWSLFPIFFIQSGSRSTLLRAHASVPPVLDHRELVTDSWSGQIRPSARFRPLIRTRCRRLMGPLETIGSIPAQSSQIPGIDADTCPVGFYGTYRRNSLHGPRRANLDLALEKSTSLSERTKLIFRLEAFNIFNHTEFRPPASGSSLSGTFGQITGTLRPENPAVGSPVYVLGGHCEIASSAEWGRFNLAE